MPSNLTPTIYRDENIDKLIKNFMYDGNYQKAHDIVYYALEEVKRKRYMTFKKLSPEEQKDFVYNPFEIANVAMKNVTPVLKLVNHVRGKLRVSIGGQNRRTRAIVPLEGILRG